VKYMGLLGNPATGEQILPARTNPNSNAERIVLCPEQDVEARDGFFLATSSEPWLQIQTHPNLQPGALVEIIYRASLWDDPARPIFRFWTSDGEVIDRIAPGPVAGAGIWVGRIPDHAVRASVSPANRLGLFNFEVESIRLCSPWSLLAKGWRQEPQLARSILFTRMIGWKPESDVNLDWATAFTPLKSYKEWRDLRARTIDLLRIDAPRCDWSKGVEIAIIVVADRAALTSLARTWNSLRAQHYQRWILHVVTDEGVPTLPADQRIQLISTKKATALFRSLPKHCFVSSITPGDEFPPHALACLAEEAHRSPACQLFYADEEVRTQAGTLVPIMKPRWSRLLSSTQSYLGRAVFLKGEAFSDASDEDQNQFLRQNKIPLSVTKKLPAKDVGSIRRVLLTRAPRRSIQAPQPRASAPSSQTSSPLSATIIIPTRDRADLLSLCVNSILDRTCFDNYSILIADNGSVKPGTMRVFEGLRRQSRVSIIECPGAFNYSLICNDAAAKSSADVLVFLNNDTQILSNDWLTRLVAHAASPNVGAVGAKLLYRDGRIQHIGVVLGMGGHAGHFGSRELDTEPGWLSRNLVPHEISAVTGACLAVQRWKFERVGGFDALHLPIDLNDVDLCLKLTEQGWASLLDPEVRLLHDESASRGRGTFRRLAEYASQRRHFQTRWRAWIRDDPYFHPGLSLYRRETALS
jgi:GT2 family glycosyltransferase